MPEVRILNLEFTTHCDKRCAECCCGIGINRTLEHHDWDYFVHAAAFFFGMDEVKLVGGEPTFHPKFAEYVPRLKKLFGCARLTMDTNGWGVQKYWPIISQCFDKVNYSDYHDRQALTDYMKVIPQFVNIFDAGFRRGSGASCFRAWERSGMISYADGKIYSCCAAPGVDGAIGVAPTEGWRNSLPPMPCGDCFFSEGVK